MNYRASVMRLKKNFFSLLCQLLGTVYLGSKLKPQCFLSTFSLKHVTDIDDVRPTT